MLIFFFNCEFFLSSYSRYLFSFEKSPTAIILKGELISEGAIVGDYRLGASMIEIPTLLSSTFFIFIFIVTEKLLWVLSYLSCEVDLS